jgi:hypothetical protein
VAPKKSGRFSPDGAESAHVENHLRNTRKLPDLEDLRLSPKMRARRVLDDHWAPKQTALTEDTETRGTQGVSEVDFFAAAV